MLKIHEYLRNCVVSGILCVITFVVSVKVIICNYFGREHSIVAGVFCIANNRRMGNSLKTILVEVEVFTKRIKLLLVPTAVSTDQRSL
ncbi:hypothetical protein BscR1v2_002120 [Bartonella schoenbuchensis R1]|uniref:Uncharacterized protein n=1 Tax=Bartonella schoenbuchensis (strain DSM 13525 / NCTC 13165 / R1) TaxID=687861 RepID=A0A1S6XNP7_BARSR|nr:hypothetical protein BscR1v2_002120 [Bartonella schoenbuchensis R1]